MALDGIYIKSIINELQEIINGRIDKIYQPDKNDIVFSVRNFGKTKKVRLTCNSSNPTLGYTENTYENPKSPPMFCMILRKYLSGGRIVNITQPDFERIVNIHIESLNELGDASEKKLIIEIMGKHSNIILVDDKDIILDSIKRVSHDKSSVREVLPTREYVLPPNHDKVNPLFTTREEFFNLTEPNIKAQEFIYKKFSGISPIVATEICTRANINPSDFVEQIDIDSLYFSFAQVMDAVNKNEFDLNVYYNQNYKLQDFSAIEMTVFDGYMNKKFESASQLLEFFYSEKEKAYRINQKSIDIKKILQTTIERYSKKIDLEKRAIDDTKNMDKFRIRGELITANIYMIEKGMTTIKCIDYSSEDLKEVEIPLDINLTPSENAQKYFKKYNKMKRTKKTTEVLLKQNEEELNYLESIYSTLHAAADDADINDVRDELINLGILKNKNIGKKKKKKEESKPLYFLSSDGFDIYVGKNNKQNDELTLRFADDDDIWMHTKNIPGSHVIICTNGKEVPDTTLEEGAMLAGYYSKSKNSSTVPVDYCEKKYVKKPRGAKPGMVIYTTNKTAYITPSEDFVRKLKHFQ